MASYSIEFDLLQGHDPGTGATLTNTSLKPTGWRSIGNPTGARIENQTGSPITAIYIKALNPGDRFVVNSSSLGRLFSGALVRPDAREVWFFGGGIPNDSAFWMRVPRSTEQEIKDCDAGIKCPFTGLVTGFFDREPPGVWGWVGAA